MILLDELASLQLLLLDYCGDKTSITHFTTMVGRLYNPIDLVGQLEFEISVFTRNCTSLGIFMVINRLVFLF